MPITNSKKNEIKALIFLVFLFLFTWLIVYTGIFKHVTWIDVPLHFFGGFFMAMFFVSFLRRAIAAERSVTNDIIIVLGASLLIGVAWEVFEYSSTRILPSYFSIFRGGNLFDTLKDLVIDILGSFLAFLFFKRRR